MHVSSAKPLQCRCATAENLYEFVELELFLCFIRSEGQHVKQKAQALRTCQDFVFSHSHSVCCLDGFTSSNCPLKQFRFGRGGGNYMLLFDSQPRDAVTVIIPTGLQNRVVRSSFVSSWCHGHPQHDIVIIWGRCSTRRRWTHRLSSSPGWKQSPGSSKLRTLYFHKSVSAQIGQILWMPCQTGPNNRWREAQVIRRHRTTEGIQVASGPLSLVLTFRSFRTECDQRMKQESPVREGSRLAPCFS